MTLRLHNGRMRGHHSFSLALVVAMLIASFAVIIMALVGGFR